MLFYLSISHPYQLFVLRKYRDRDSDRSSRYRDAGSRGRASASFCNAIAVQVRPRVTRSRKNCTIEKRRDRSSESPDREKLMAADRRRWLSLFSISQTRLIGGGRSAVCVDCIDCGRRYRWHENILPRGPREIWQFNNKTVPLPKRKARPELPSASNIEHVAVDHTFYMRKMRI